MFWAGEMAQLLKVRLTTKNIRTIVLCHNCPPGIGGKKVEEGEADDECGKLLDICGTFL